MAVRGLKGHDGKVPYTSDSPMKEIERNKKKK